LDLPTDRPRPSLHHHRGSEEPIEWPTHLVQSLRQLSTAEDATLYMTLLAAFQALLYRYTGQTDTCLGSPIANRTRAETEDLIGFFVNTLVLRGDLSGNPTFRELLQRVRGQALEAFAHQEIPFEQVVEILQPERSLSRTPLFQVMFALQNAPRTELVLGDLELEPLEGTITRARFDLTFWVTEVEDRLEGRVEYSVELFDRSTIRRLLRHQRNLLRALIADPGCPIQDLPLLDASERHQVVQEWNDTGTEIEGELLHSLIESQLRETPDRVSLVFEEVGSRQLAVGRAETESRNQNPEPDRETCLLLPSHLSCAELDRRSNSLARSLQERGLGPESLAGVCLERSLEMVVSLLAVLKAGGAYVPLDPSYPRLRLEHMLEDAPAAVLLSHPGLSNRLPQGRAPLLINDALRNGAPSDSPPSSGVQALHPAYVIFTSGSTGRPKGSAIPHRGICNRLLWMQRQYRLDSRDRVMQKTPYSFDVSVWEFFWPLLAGAPLVIARPEGHKDSGYLVRLIRRQMVSLMHFVPSMLQAFLEEEGLEGCLSLRQVIASGEALTRSMENRFLERIPRSKLDNLYGPTEASVDVTFEPAHWQRRESALPIGRPIDNTCIAVLDRQGLPVPMGVPGELHIGGAGLARGYQGRAGLTAQRFVPDRSAPHPGARLYRSGDLARRLPDGRLEFLGRLDFQVKLRGFRIELGEIEAVLVGLTDVEQAVVVMRDERLIGYVSRRSQESGIRSQEEGERRNRTERGGRTQSSADHSPDLRSGLEAHLPEYMVPSVIVELDALPLTSSGKVDRKALPEVGPQAAGRGGKPQTPVQEMLAGLWCQLLEQDEAGIEDNFFDLGGHSLLATQVMSRIRSSLRVDLPLRVIFEAPTIEALSGRIEQARLSGRPAPPPLRPIPRDGSLPLSYAQQRLLFLDQLDPGGSLYNIPAALQLEGQLDVPALQATLNRILQRHEALRCRFRLQDGRPQMEIEPQETLSLPIADLSNLHPSAAKSERNRLIRREAQRPFDLANGPLLRATLLVGAVDGPKSKVQSPRSEVQDLLEPRISVSDSQLPTPGSPSAAAPPSPQVPLTSRPPTLKPAAYSLQ
ncbi:MAG: amino acid adenylation domain-containing protein, partial [Acidobacteriota bacterium]